MGNRSWQKNLTILSILYLWVSVFSVYGQVMPTNENFIKVEPTKTQKKMNLGTLDVSPAFIDIEIKNPTSEKKVLLTYKNNSTETVVLTLYAIDFKQKDLDGAISFLGREPGSFSYSLVSFLTLEADKLTLEAGEEKELAVYVKNRKDLSPGGHYAAIIAQIEGGSEGETLDTVVKPSLSSLLLLRKVGGEQFNLSILDGSFPDGSVEFSYPKSMTFTVGNEGNIHLTPYGRIEIRDMLGRLTHQGTMNTSSLRVFPESRRYIDAQILSLKTPLPVSINTMVVAGTDSLSKTTISYKESFLYINPVFISIVILFLGMVLILKRRK